MQISVLRVVYGTNRNVNHLRVRQLRCQGRVSLAAQEVTHAQQTAREAFHYMSERSGMHGQCQASLGAPVG